MTVAPVKLTFDGSFQGKAGAGIGVTLGFVTESPFLEVSCPTVSFDAQRTEAMGLVLGALCIAALPPGRVIVEGDSKYVIGLWNKEWEVRDVFLFNCV